MKNNTLLEEIHAAINPYIKSKKSAESCANAIYDKLINRLALSIHEKIIKLSEEEISRMGYIKNDS